MSRDNHDLPAAGAAPPGDGGGADSHELAFEALRGPLHRYLRRRLHRTEDIEDLAQEVYLRLLRFTDFKQVKSPAAYVFRVALHVLYEFKSHQHRSPVTFDSDSANAASEHLPDSAARPDEVHEQSLLQARSRAIVERLPPMQRLVLLMATREELSYDEIAAKLGISASTARVHLFRAMATIKDESSKA